MKTGISYGEAIIKPGTPEYAEAMISIYGEPGLSFDPETLLPVDPPLDALGRKKPVAAKTGSIDPKPEIKRNVLVFRDHTLVFPDVYLNYFVVGPPEDTRGFNYLFARAGCKKAPCIEEADLVVFTGGPDVDPAYYHEEPHESVYSVEERDLADIAVYSICLDEGIPMVGVCRGAQFGAVMGGYKLFQDMDNHQSDHSMFCARTQITIDKVSSKHHQCVRPGPGMEMLAWSNVSTRKYFNNEHYLEPKNPGKPLLDLEAFFIRDTGFFGVQGHPEYKGYNAYAKWFLETLNDCFNENPDFEWRIDTQRLRMKEDLLNERKYRLPSLGEKQQEILEIVNQGEK